MTTIFTDDFSSSETDIEITVEEFVRGSELTFSTRDNREFRLVLSDAQFQDLADQLLFAGYEQQAL